ncbi:Uncharacterized protein FWK35_00017208 [Aphis craccivora]|uniref:Uncharacterized protein n=1 Tax=Aphis craccivora TaxID=307492 RepID=A0A6G0ZD26_APHCR|nr:Uncharacterized protein FWK35_00017208 [Aphis craccivora]
MGSASVTGLNLRTINAEFMKLTGMSSRNIDTCVCTLYMYIKYIKAATSKNKNKNRRDRQKFVMLIKYIHPRPVSTAVLYDLYSWRCALVCNFSFLHNTMYINLPISKEKNNNNERVTFYTFIRIRSLVT